MDDLQRRQEHGGYLCQCMGYLFSQLRHPASQFFVEFPDESLKFLYKRLQVFNQVIDHPFIQHLQLDLQGFHIIANLTDP